MKKGAWTPLTKANTSKNPKNAAFEAQSPPTDSLLESGPLSALTQNQKGS